MVKMTLPQSFFPQARLGLRPSWPGLFVIEQYEVRAPPQSTRAKPEGGRRADTKRAPSGEPAGVSAAVLPERDTGGSGAGRVILALALGPGRALRRTPADSFGRVCWSVCQGGRLGPPSGGSLHPAFLSVFVRSLGHLFCHHFSGPRRWPGLALAFLVVATLPRPLVRTSSCEHRVLLSGPAGADLVSFRVRLAQIWLGFGSWRKSSFLYTSYKGKLWRFFFMSFLVYFGSLGAPRV